jgi:putative colanic acid biosynthesis UDP-glucose lipid carrier transferase
VRRHTGRFSGYIRPFSYALDLININVLSYFLLINTHNVLGYHIFITLAWIVISWNVGFYEVYRFTKLIEIISKIFKQYVLYIIVTFAYIGYFMKFSEPFLVLKYISLSIALISIVKIFIYYFLKRFRAIYGGNFRKVVIVGNGNSSSQLANFFNENPDYGYKLEKIFDFKSNRNEQIESCFSFILNSNIDEMYCSLSDLTSAEVDKFIYFADNNLKTLKFLPRSKDILSRNLTFDYYDYIPVISLRNIPLDKTANKIAKRFCDIIFSMLIIIFVLSWLIPIVAILIKLESKGPVFFRQNRNGLNFHEFDCYKFRSMTVGASLDPAKPGDSRVTGMGEFLRKTSIDELPQFFNVLLGNMSVVGPRPHAPSYNKMYNQQTKIDKFMLRHLIKPGITGLAQVKGYRGEVKVNNDIINRVKYDIFYIENWSMLLDVKIVFMTVYNAIKGEEKAY